MNKQDIVNKELNKIVRDLSKNNNINSVHLFGSVFSGKPNGLSDIDICIDGDLSFEEQIEIKQLFSDEYDVSFLNELYPWVKINVFRNGKTLYVKDKSRLYSQAFKTIKQYEELEYMLKRRAIEKFGKWQI